MSQFEYYYAHQSEQFVFYRIPKALFSEERFSRLSSDSKVLYGLMLDRMSLSRRNAWVDKMDRVYIYFTLEDVMSYLHCAKEKACKLIAELDTRGIGLIETRRQGLGRANLIYVKDFTSSP
jgi:Cdc6-like AAA superfamily ATPase